MERNANCIHDVDRDQFGLCAAGHANCSPECVHLVERQTSKGRQICHIDMTVVTDGETTDATGSISFDGTGADIVSTLVHIFYALELDPVRAHFLSQEAVRHFHDTYEEAEK